MNVQDPEKIKACREQNDCRFPVPGKIKGHPEMRGDLGKRCPDIVGRTMADATNGYLINFQTKCKPGYSKIGVVVDEENDFHYYRQDSNGWWSHKPGGRPVINVDSTGARIYNPELAARYYPAENAADTELNYDSFCTYMCVPRVAPIKIGGVRKSRKGNRRRRS